MRANLKQLKLPTMSAECEKLAREAAANNAPYESYLLRLTELEVATRSANALAARIRATAFPVAKDFDTYDFTALPRRFASVAPRLAIIWRGFIVSWAAVAKRRRTGGRCWPSAPISLRLVAVLPSAAGGGEGSLEE